MKAITTGLIISTLLVLVVVAGVFTVHKAEPTVQAEPQLSKYEVGPPDRQELLELVNMERAKVGAKPLKELNALDKSAQYKADDMQKYHYFDHVSPHDKKQGYTYVFDDTGSLCSYASENLHRTDSGDSTSWNTIEEDGWVSSKPHYKAMVDNRYEYVGFGYTGIYTVAHFCDAK